MTTVYSPAGKIGADGIARCDFDDNGALDFVSCWEQSDFCSLTLCSDANCTTAQSVDLLNIASTAWEGVDCGDMDNDGIDDLLASGQNGKVYIAFSPSIGSQLTAASWTEVELTAVTGLQQWLAIRRANIDGGSDFEVVIGGRTGAPATIRFLKHAGSPRTGANWTATTMGNGDWVKSIIVNDFDNDGCTDVVVSDAQGALAGSRWLENTDAGCNGSAWTNRTILSGGTKHTEFIALADLTGDGLVDVVGGSSSAPSTSTMTIAKRLNAAGTSWSEIAVPVPTPLSSPAVGLYQGVAVCDVNNDTWLDLVVTNNEATGTRKGIFWLRGGPNERGKGWDYRPIGDGIKFDDVYCHLGNDGRWNVCTSEQGDEVVNTTDLGVVCFENPL